VEENAQKQGEAVFYRPGVKVRLKGAAETLFSWSAAAGRAGGFNPDVARRRAYTGLAQKIQESFTPEFERRMNNF
jgi:hypothetical protein